MYSITKTFKFDAAHRLFTMPEGHKCSCIHGHSWTVRVSINVDTILYLENPNMLIDFGVLKLFQKHLDAKFDHCLILHPNDPFVSELEGKTKILTMPDNMDTTAENMAKLFTETIRYMFVDLIKNKVNSGFIRVEVDETVGNTAAYQEDFV